MIEHVERDEGNGYRSYTPQHVVWIEFLKRLRATGMPIRDIQRYTKLVRQGEQTMPKRQRLQLLKQHQHQEVEEHLKEVERHLEVIRFKVVSYEHLHTSPQTVLQSENLP